ncbi:MAG: hypothetical protein JEY97_05490 [Bacteroidales bacterium]|nr:hypothetical protein [Bacteroidales bacterium]
MYDFVSLNLKCPVCGKSLMDKDHRVDNEPSIKLNIEIAGKKGVIRLSSIYGSYNFISDIELPKGEVASFFCPSCEAKIISDQECLSCGAPMAPFYLDMGGKVSICSRSGCKNHKIEFDDLSVALKKLYQEYGLSGSHHSKITSQKVEKKETKPKIISDFKETIESGAFLQAYCPHCKKSLIENDMLKLKITNGETGFLMLSPYLNVFTSKSTILLSEDKTVAEVHCPHCDKSLIVTNIKCGNCKSPVAKISISARTKLLDFYLCTKKGCRWHGLSEDDLYEIRLEDSDEW